LINESNKEGLLKPLSNGEVLIFKIPGQ